MHQYYPQPWLAPYEEKGEVGRGECWRGWLWGAFGGGGEQSPGAAQVFDSGEDGPDDGEQEDDVREGKQVTRRGGGGAPVARPSGKAVAPRRPRARRMPPTARRVSRVFCSPQRPAGMTTPWAAASERRPETRNSRVTMTMTESRRG